MKILVTGAKGFIGKNLIAELRNRGYQEIYEYDTDTREELLEEYCRDCGFVYNLAGVNRPQKQSEFMEGNFGFASRLLNALMLNRNVCPVMLASSIQAGQDNPYGRSKYAGENLFFRYGAEHSVEIDVYRFPNVFGKWCRPNYNSVIATFCYNIANNLPIQVNDPSANLRLVYIDDVVEELINAMKGHPSKNDAGFCYVPVEHEASLGELAGLIESFRESRISGYVPDMTEGKLIKKLYSTYVSYLPSDRFSYPLKMNADERGSFTEIIRTSDRGQFSVNISKPGITKGDHWHHTKTEKFAVISGSGVISFRKIDSKEIVEYRVSGEQLQVVDIPPGYTHAITNTGDTDLVTFMWCNECYNQERPDTYFLRVEEEING